MRLSEALLMAITIIALPAAASDPANPNGGSWVQTPYQQPARILHEGGRTCCGFIETSIT